MKPTSSHIIIQPVEESDAIVPEDLMSVKNLHHVDIKGIINPCGVYFLMLSDEVVYVGQSVSAMSRIITHINEDRKQFTSAFFLPVPSHLLNIVEQSFIKSIKPVYNLRPGELRTEHKKILNRINMKGLTAK